jgi:hypothetical protein
MENFTNQEKEILVCALDNSIDALEKNRRILTDRAEIDMTISRFKELRDKIKEP